MQCDVTNLSELLNEFAIIAKQELLVGSVATSLEISTWE